MDSSLAVRVMVSSVAAVMISVASVNLARFFWLLPHLCASAGGEVLDVKFRGGKPISEPPLCNFTDGTSTGLNEIIGGMPTFLEGAIAVILTIVLTIVIWVCLAPSKD